MLRIMQQEVSHWFGPYKIFHRKVNLFERNMTLQRNMQQI